LYLIILFLPLLSSLIVGFLGRKLGIRGAQYTSCISILITTIFALFIFYEVGFNHVITNIKLFTWINIEQFYVLWSFNFDALTVSMLIPVLIVSLVVHIYSIEYMSHDPHNQRFFSYLSLFTFMMILLVTSNNFILMFVGWEGVGVCSYLLVSFWFTRIAANQSSISAFLTNRVGDSFLTIGMFIILLIFGNLDYNLVFSLSPYISNNIIIFIGICLLIGAMAKSSQIGLHVWLPMAMEGPTPVSALIHAATMVTAGVYLLIRSSPIIEYSNTVLLICLWLGAITTMFSSLIGFFQKDIKKIIAYSTMSQLGMMVLSIGLSCYNLALFHLINHAFYKALLFLGAGSVIHAMMDNQDLRKYGGLKLYLPLTYSVILIASFSLIAIPFMSGFYSKDFILESAYGQLLLSSYTVYIISILGASFTTLYSIKILYLTFITNPNGININYNSAHEGKLFMTIPLIILAIFSIFFGFISKDLFIGIGTDFFLDNSIFIHYMHEISIDTEFVISTYIKILPFIITISLMFIYIYKSEYKIFIFINSNKINIIIYNIFCFLNQRFFIEFIYNKYISEYLLDIGSNTTKFLDKGSVEYIGPYGLEKSLIYLSETLSKLDTGRVNFYSLFILCGLIIYIYIWQFVYIKEFLLIIVINIILFTSKITKNKFYNIFK
jgi:NADH-ubiquinone oxidoreductase chain 5